MKPSKLDAVICCDLIRGVYSAFEAWEQSGRPREGSFEWKDCLIWGESMSYERRPGPRERHHWVREWAPMGTCLLIGKTLYVVFRGTCTAHEWNNNVRFPLRSFRVPIGADVNLLAPREYYMGNVHDGFADSMESLQQDLIAEVKRLIPGAERVIVTGHSLGGAIGTLAFASILTRLPIARMTTGMVFGSPRVGNQEFKRAFYTVGNPETFWRYELMHDPVVDVPPRKIMWVWEYNHVGEQILLTEQFGSDRKNHAIESYRTAIMNLP